MPTRVFLDPFHGADLPACCESVGYLPPNKGLINVRRFEQNPIWGFKVSCFWVYFLLARFRGIIRCLLRKLFLFGLIRSFASRVWFATIACTDITVKCSGRVRIWVLERYLHLRHGRPLPWLGQEQVLALLRLHHFPGKQSHHSLIIESLCLRRCSSVSFHILFEQRPSICIWVRIWVAWYNLACSHLHHIELFKHALPCFCIPIRYENSPAAST